MATGLAELFSMLQVAVSSLSMDVGVDLKGQRMKKRHINAASVE